MSRRRHETLAFSGYWRLLWFGKWKFHTRIRNEPVVQVTLGKLAGPDADPGTAPALTGKIRDCDLPVGELPPMHLNAVFSEGRQIKDSRLALPSEQRLPFSEGLDFSRGNWRIIGREHCDARGELVIPRKRQRFELAGDREALFLAVGKNGDPYARVIPCMEVARFFYAPTTGMARAVFSDAFIKPEESLWDPRKCHWDPASRRLHIHLRKNRMDADARLLGYFFLVDEARKAAAHIFKRAAVEAARTEPAQGRAVQAYPPITTAVPCRYRYIPIGAPGQDRRLVTRLESVDLPVPFRDLEWTRDGDGRTTPHRYKAPPKSSLSPHSPHPGEDDLVDENFTAEPQDPDKPPRRTPFDEAEVRFPSLSATPARKSDKHTQKTRAAEPSKPTEDGGTRTTLGSRQQGSGNQRASLGNEAGEVDQDHPRPLDYDEVRWDADDPFAALVETLKKLREEQGVEIRFFRVLPRQMTDDDVIYNAFDAKYTGEERYAPHVGAWYFSDDSGSPRLLVAAEVRVQTPSGGRFYYVIDMQARKGRREGVRLVRMPACARIAPDKLARALGKLPGRQALSIALSGALVRSQRHVGAFAKDADPGRLLAAVMEKLGDSAPLSKAVTNIDSPFFEAS